MRRPGRRAFDRSHLSRAARTARRRLHLRHLTAASEHRGLV